MRTFVLDKTVQAGALIRCVGNPYPGARVSAFVVESGADGEQEIPLDDGPLVADAPTPGDIIIDDGERVSWMTPERFAERYEEVPE